ncbi:MAG TPA: heparan-alpha-glucosaminide N-acetyltransferase domain-containing protein, partial [bacterium]|nr:heparan-alpha-glucosaminide N-acetyltransferase domain-containing protein [bacterium]
MTTKKFNTLFHYVYIICDYGAVLGSFIIAYVIRRTADVATSLDLVEVPVLNFAFRDFIRIAPWISLLWIGLFVSTRHYVRIEKRRFTQELYNIFQGASLGVLGLMVMGFFMGHQLFSRLITVYAWAISIPALLLSRTLVHAVQRSFWKKGIGTKKVLVCGLGRMGRQLLEGIRQHGWPGNQIVGVLDEKYHPKQGFMFFNKNKTGPIIEHDPHQAAGFPVLGRPADLVDILTQHTVDDVIIGLGEFSDQEALSIMQTCRDRGILFSFIPDILGFASSFKVHTTINGIPL